MCTRAPCTCAHAWQAGRQAARSTLLTYFTYFTYLQVPKASARESKDSSGKLEVNGTVEQIVSNKRKEHNTLNEHLDCIEDILSPTAPLQVHAHVHVYVYAPGGHVACTWWACGVYMVGCTCACGECIHGRVHGHARAHMHVRACTCTLLLQVAWSQAVTCTCTHTHAHTHIHMHAGCVEQG